MLFLKRNIYWNQLMKCHISEENIYPGDYYYQDDEDGTIIKATVYKEMKDKKKEDEWDYTKLNSATSEREYRELVKRATIDMLAASILDRKVAGQYDPAPDKEDEFVQEIYDNHIDRGEKPC